MNKSLRLYVACTCLCALGIGLETAQWHASVEAGSASEGAPAWQGTVEDLRALERELDEKSAGVLRRVVEKQRLAHEVCEGRMTLLEAAARFRDLNTMPPAFRAEYLTTAFAGGSEAERLCRHVLAFVRAELPLAASQAEEMTARFEAVLQAHIESNTLQLPQ